MPSRSPRSGYVRTKTTKRINPTDTAITGVKHTAASRIAARTSNAQYRGSGASIDAGVKPTTAINSNSTRNGASTYRGPRSTLVQLVLRLDEVASAASTSIPKVCPLPSPGIPCRLLTGPGPRQSRALIRVTVRYTSMSWCDVPQTRDVGPNALLLDSTHRTLPAPRSSKKGKLFCNW